MVAAQAAVAQVVAAQAVAQAAVAATAVAATAVVAATAAAVAAKVAAAATAAADPDSVMAPILDRDRAEKTLAAMAAQAEIIPLTTLGKTGDINSYCRKGYANDAT